MKTLSIDIETYSSVDLAKCGVYKYTETTDFDILLFGYSTDGGPVQVVDLARGETIPPDDLPYIFDRFHKSDRSRSLDREGVGLGLYLVKSILDAHGEDIAVTSRDGVTEFVFSLTLAPQTKGGEKRK